MKKSLLILMLMLVPLLIISGCSTGDGQTGMYLKEATPKPNSYWTDENTNKMTMKFSEKIEKQNIILKENGRELDNYNLEVDNDTITISGLKLDKRNKYSVSYNVRSKHRDVNSTYYFYTSPPLPDIQNQNKIYMQAFYWDMGTGEYARKYPEEKDLWQLIAQRSEEFKEMGITTLMLPPAHKGMWGKDDRGYTNYDMWDLGEFDQKGTTRTKWGTKAQLEDAISTLKMNDINVMYDATLNHKMGASNSETVNLSQNSPDKAGETIKAWTDFNNMEGREKYYTSEKFPHLYNNFQWNKNSFDGVDYNAINENTGEFLFEGKTWDYTLESGEYDLIMGADIDYYNYDSNGNPNPNINVINEMKAWGKWITEDIGFTGFRLDAIKHIDANFLIDWLNYLREQDSEMIFLGEFWGGASSTVNLLNILNSKTNKNIGDLLKMYDFSIRATLSEMDNGGFNMATLKKSPLKNELERANIKDNRLLFVESHDTTREDTKFSQPIELKTQAYAYIFTKEHGTPMLFWKDYYQTGDKESLDKILLARRYYAYGNGRDAKINDEDVYSYVREGNDIEGTGLVNLIANGYSGKIVSKKINAGRPHTTYIDLMNNVQGTVETDENGVGKFKVYNEREKGTSIWIPIKWENWQSFN